MRDIENQINSIDEEIEKLKADKENLLQKQKKLDTLTLDKRVAIILHAGLCRYNHNDDCSWEYYDDFNPDTWHNCYAHKMYLDKATVLINFICRSQQLDRNNHAKAIISSVNEIIEILKK